MWYDTSMKAVLIKKKDIPIKRVHFSTLSEMLEKTQITPREFANKTCFPYQTVKRFLKNGRCPKYYLIAEYENGSYSIPLSRTVREGVDVISADVKNSAILTNRVLINRSENILKIDSPKPVTTDRKLFYDSETKRFNNLSIELSKKIRQERIDHIASSVDKIINNLRGVFLQ